MVLVWPHILQLNGQQVHPGYRISLETCLLLPGDSMVSLALEELRGKGSTCPVSFPRCEHRVEPGSSRRWRVSLVAVTRISVSEMLATVMSSDAGFNQKI